MNRAFNRNAVKRGRGGRRGIPPTVKGISERLGVYKADPVNVRKLRFQCSTTGTYNTSRSALLSLWCVGTIANNSVTSCFAGIRVKSVTIFTAGTSSAGATQLNYSSSSIIWLSENAPDCEYSVTGNPDHPGSLTSEPPVNSLASFWQSYNSGALGTNLFQLALNQNDIVDIVFEWVPANGTETYVLTPVAVVTVGTFYYLALDGRASNKIVPVSNPTTA